MLIYENSKRRLEQIKTATMNAGIKLTKQRLAIYTLIASSDAHPSADDIYQHLHKSIPGLSLDTVYRTLWMLHDLGLIGLVKPFQESIRFDTNPARHHHFICTLCGAIIDFQSRKMDQIRYPVETNGLGEAASLHVEIWGICQSCLKPEPKS